MKDSGIEWIGEIPEDWEITSVKSKYRLVTGFTPDTENPNYYDDNGYVWVNISDLSNDRYIVDSKKKISDLAIKECKGNLIKKGSLLYSFKLSVGQVSFAGNDLYTNEAIASFIEDESINLNFFYYMSSFAIIQNANENIYGAKLLNQQLIKNAKIVFPPLNEQQKIANFLDKKVAEIDHIITKTQASIEEYKRYKQSIITEAVTKGLNPDVKMKDSGIEWIAEIPEEWEVFRGKVILKILSRSVLEDDTVITCFRDGEVTLRSKRREEGFTMADKEFGYQGIEPGDLVVHGMDGFAGAIGISDSRGKGSPVLNVLDSKQNKEYLMYYLRSMAYSDVFTAIATGIRVRSCDLRWNKLANLPYPIPPLQEQEDIVFHINSNLNKINKVLAQKVEFLMNLEAYKKSLIYEVVTGKKEVV